MTVDESSYQEVVSGVWKVMGCDACALFLLDEKTNELVLKGSVGYPDVPVDWRISLRRPEQHPRPVLQRGIPDPRGRSGSTRTWSCR